MAVIILITTFVLFFLFNFELSVKIYIEYRKSPPGISCKLLYETYDEKEMETAAGLEYLYNEENGFRLRNM